jgi:hypothetical protein
MFTTKDESLSHRQQETFLYALSHFAVKTWENAALWYYTLQAHSPF